MPGARTPGRGALHVYLGAAPGVGKTYAMLVEGRRLADDGVDVVAGWVDTHGRMDTGALAMSLDRMAPPASCTATPCSTRWTSTASWNGTRGGAGRRARACQRARLASRQALAGRRGAPRRRDRRDHHGQHPARRQPEGGRGARDGNGPARDGPRRLPGVRGAASTSSTSTRMSCAGGSRTVASSPPRRQVWPSAACSTPPT